MSTTFPHNGPMAIHRTFLSWDQPILQSAADWLLSHAAASREDRRSLPLVDLSETLIVVPGGLAGRRLVEILIEKAEAQEKSLVPPQVITPSELPEKLYEAKLPFASDLTQQFAWGETLRSFSPEELRPLIPYPPEAADFGTWRDYGDTIRRVYRELISDGLDFTEVATAAESLEGFTEQDRWEVLARLQQEYLRRLDQLEMWDKQSARLYAIKHQECYCDRHLVLLATVDLNRATRQMLDQVAAKSGRVTALVGAPESWSDHFDEHGCLISERWAEVPVEVDWQQVALVDGPTQQADQVVGYVAEAAERYSTKQIVVGLPEESLLGEVRRIFGLHGLKCRFGPGQSVVGTLPFRLLESLIELSQSRQYQALAAALRHPDIFQAVQFATVGIQNLDKWYNNRLPSLIDGKLGVDEMDAAIEKLSQLTKMVSDQRLPLTQWRGQIRDLLLAVYGDRTIDLDTSDQQEIARPLEAIVQAMVQWDSIPEPLSQPCTATEMLRVLRNQLGGTTVPDPLDPEAIEALGWLELPLMDAPVCVVTSFCDGLIPSSNTADLFLPNALRKLLGLEDDSLRYARDAYQVQVIQHTRDQAWWIVPKRNADGDPMAPSRLLFTGDGDDLPQRVLKFFGTPLPPANRAKVTSDEPRDHRQRIAIPQPVFADGIELPPWDRVSATLINQYLKCPYRFYLRYVAKLRGVDDLATELSGGLFGSLAHDTLQAFGTSQVKDSSDEKVIFDFVSSTLSDLALREYGSRPMATIRLQIEQLRLRLREFARAQSLHRQQGWVIYLCEAEMKDPYPKLAVDDSHVELEGRIDRIDHNPETGDWAVWDYKTGDGAGNPEKDHHVGSKESRRWTSVQLPFYRHLVKGVGVRGTVSLGYITLPKQGEEVQFRRAKWTDDDLSMADETILTAVRAIRTGTFFPPSVDLRYADEFSRLCQDSVLGKWEIPSS